MRRGKRASGRRRLRELTRSVVETMGLLEEVREKHTGVGGMSKALIKVRMLGGIGFSCEVHQQSSNRWTSSSLRTSRFRPQIWHGSPAGLQTPVAIAHADVGCSCGLCLLETLTGSGWGKTGAWKILGWRLVPHHFGSTGIGLDTRRFSIAHVTALYGHTAERERKRYVVAKLFIYTHTHVWLTYKHVHLGDPPSWEAVVSSAQPNKTMPVLLGE